MAWYRCVGGAGGSLKLRTASGRIATFSTNMAEAFKSLKSEINPVQSGTGTPSPQNVRPISGFSALNVTRTGVNLVNIPDKVQTGGGYLFSNYSINLAQGTYTLSFDSTANSGQCNFVVKKDNTSIGSVTANLTTGRVSLTVTITQKSTKIECYANTGGTFSNIQLELGNQATEYHAYNGQTATVNFGQTVYGGVADVTNGKVTITHGIVDLGTLNYNYNGTFFYADMPTNSGAVKPSGIYAICSIYPEHRASASTQPDKSFAVNNNSYGTSKAIFIKDSAYSDAQTFKNSLNGAQLVYELATPIEIDTTPENLTAIVGVNNVYADTNGDTEVKYLYRE